MDKPIVWLRGEILTPPFSKEARLKAGYLLRELQNGELLEMPDSRPMPVIGKRCHELRINDNGSDVTWRIIYRLDRDAVVIADIFKKKTNQTPMKIIDTCISRLAHYDKIIREI